MKNWRNKKIINSKKTKRNNRRLHSEETKDSVAIVCRLVSSPSSGVRSWDPDFWNYAKDGWKGLVCPCRMLIRHRPRSSAAFLFSSFLLFLPVLYQTLLLVLVLLFGLCWWRFSCHSFCTTSIILFFTLGVVWKNCFDTKRLEQTRTSFVEDECCSGNMCCVVLLFVIIFTSARWCDFCAFFFFFYNWSRLMENDG